MAFTSTVQFQQTVFFDSLHSSFSRRFDYFRRIQSFSPFSLKQCTLHSLNHFSIRSRKPDAKPRISGTTPTKIIFPVDDSTSTPMWIKCWGKESHFRLIPKRPRAALDYRIGLSSDDEDFGTSASTGSSTMSKIVDKLKKFGYMDDTGKIKEQSLPEKGSVEDIFYAEDGILPNCRGGLSLDLNEEVRFPWEKPRDGMEWEDNGGDSVWKKKSKTVLAELTLPQGELRRLRHLAIRAKSKTKIGGAGVTHEIVDAIREKWQTAEVVRLKCEGAPALNMKRMHEILERKTGGMVIWRSGTSISLYRGVDYENTKPVKKQYHNISNTYDRPLNTFKHSRNSTDNLENTDLQDVCLKSIDVQNYDIKNIDVQIKGEHLTPFEKKNDTELSSEVKYEDEIDKLLDSLGPRYTDWPGSDPLPVDADLLPGIVPGYKPPFRVLPYGVRRTLGLKEGTALRRLARVLPPHFALGRSRNHQGLAVAMEKLWGKSCIAKIALKRGVQLTTSERIAAEIKGLTGGVILSRNKDYIVFYRGKDFLSAEVSKALVERETLAKNLQDEEEQARVRASSSVILNSKTVKVTEEQGTTGTLGETLEADARWGKKLDNEYEEKMIKAAEAARHADLVRKLEKKLYLAERKVMQAERALAKVEESLRPIERKTDSESITEEERFMFRKLGLRMKAFLLLGRRGVFDGTVENMHLHWKYRELVKVIVKAKTFMQVKHIALSLEAESGGVLVSVDKISKGYAIVVFRGKDYHRPATLRPKNLLTKRKALARSIELQRHAALNRHISSLLSKVEKLKAELGKMEDVEGRGDDELYSNLGQAYNSEDDENEIICTIMVNSRESGSIEMWDKEVTNIFCDLCVAEIVAGNRPTTYFNKVGWENIAKKFQELTGRNYDRLKFKNRWDQLKKDWKIWKELKRGATGLGWDPIRKTVDASDEWWNEKLQVIPNAKKFRMNGIEPELEEKLDQMFKGVVATGLHFFNPNEEGFTGTQPDLPSDNFSDSGEGPPLTPLEVGSSSQAKKPRMENKRKSKDSLVTKSIDKLIEAFSAPPPVPPEIVDLTLAGCLSILDSIPEVLEDKNFYVRCVQLLEDPTRRKFFMMLRSEMRYEYLRVLVHK